MTHNRTEQLSVSENRRTLNQRMESFKFRLEDLRKITIYKRRFTTRFTDLHKNQHSSSEKRQLDLCSHFPDMNPLWLCE